MHGNGLNSRLWPRELFVIITQSLFSYPIHCVCWSQRLGVMKISDLLTPAGWNLAWIRALVCVLQTVVVYQNIAVILPTFIELLVIQHSFP